MTNSDTIYCTNPNDLRLELKCRKNAKGPKHEESEVLETHQFDDKDYPDFRRMVRRFRNRSFYIKNKKKKCKLIH